MTNPEARNTFNVRPVGDSTWTYHPHPPLPPISAYLVDGWTSITQLRAELNAVEQFESQHLPRFVAQFGQPPTP